MSAPTRDRSKWIPPPPLPEFYTEKTTKEGEAKISTSVKAPSDKGKSSSKDSSDEKHLPPPRLDTPPAQTSAHAPGVPPRPLVSLPEVNVNAYGQLQLPTNLPPLPPLPLGVTTVETSGMAYHYTQHFHHGGHHPITTTYHHQSSRPQVVPIVAVPHPPQTRQATSPPLQTEQQPQLATFHVCRVCCRPRSEKYHLQNPIPFGGVPPPPEICRRCRVKNVEEKDQHVQLVATKESMPVKIGVACLSRDESCVTKERVREEVSEVRLYFPLPIRFGETSRQQTDAPAGTR
jgi:hypothetical protein